MRQRSRTIGRWPREPWLQIGGLLALVGMGLFGLSCQRQNPADDGSSALRVVVSIPPQAWFVERIGGGRLEVETLVDAGQSPHHFDPTLKQMARLGDAAAYFLIGIPFEQSLQEKLSEAYPQLRLVDTCQGIQRHVTEDADDAHGHEHEHEHHGEVDPHTWMSPRLAKAQAKNIADALCELDPSGAEAYRANLAELQADLDALDARITAALAPVRGRPLYVFHPAFGYFAEAYGLRQVAVETGGKSPSLKHVQTLIDRARADGTKVIFVQPQFSRTAAETIAREIGGAVVPVDPLARDYLTNLAELAERVAESLSTPAAEASERS